MQCYRWSGGMRIGPNRTGRRCFSGSCRAVFATGTGAAGCAIAFACGCRGGRARELRRCRTRYSRRPTAAAALLAVLVRQQNADDLSGVQEDWDIAAGGEELELIEELEFYDWLKQSQGRS